MCRARSTPSANTDAQNPTGRLMDPLSTLHSISGPGPLPLPVAPPAPPLPPSPPPAADVSPPFPAPPVPPVPPSPPVLAPVLVELADVDAAEPPPLAAPPVSSPHAVPSR